MSTDKYGGNYYFAGMPSSETKYAVWRPDITLERNYDVYAWYPQGSKRSAKAPYTVYWNGGSQAVQVNQQTNGGQWNLLTGGKPFAVGTSGYVKLSNKTGETGRVVIADATKFVYAGS